MRTLSTVLTRLQQSKGARPVINVTIDPEGTPATYTINHLLKMDEDEEPYRQYTTLLYQNAGGAFTNVNYKGKKAIISMGYSLNGEEFTSALPPMWIMSQELQSSQGKLQCELKLKGIPDLLYDDRASQHYYAYIPGGNLANGTGTATGTPVSLKEGINTVAVTAVGTFTVELNEDTTGIATGDGVCIVSGGTQVLVSGANIITTTGSPGNITITLGSVKYNLTIQQLLTAVAQATLPPFTHCPAYSIVFDSVDALMTMFKPKNGFQIYANETRLGVIRKLLDYTTCCMRVESDGAIHIMVPTTSGTTYDYEYSLKSGHPFFAKTYKETLVIPNCIVVKSNPSDETQYSATYTEASYSLMPVTQFEYCSLESNEQAAAIAAALIYKYAIQADGGAAQVPVNCGAEVLDYVKVTDEREEDSRVGNLGTIHRHYNFELPYLRMTFSFGGWLTHRDLVNQISALSSGEGTLQSASYNQLSAKEAWIGKLGVDELDIQWIDPEGNIDLSLIGDNLDNLPDGEVYGRVKQTHLEAGALKLDEFVVYKPGYDPSTKQKEITKSPVPPTNPAINDLWLDTSVSPNALKQWTGATWKVCSATNLDQLPDGVAYRRVASSALTANGLVVLDNVQIGQYGLVKNTDISAGHINLSSCLGTLDNIQDGTTFGRLYQTDIRSGHIALTSYTKAEGKWYNEGGVTIDVADGIVVAYGSGKVQLNSEGLKGVYNGIMQVKIDSTTGEMIAGAGAVKLGSYGLKTYNGTALQCYIGTDGKIVGAGGNFQLGANYIDIYGQCLEFYQPGGGVPAGIAYISNDFNITSPTSMSISGAGATIQLQTVSGQNAVHPGYTGTNLGTSSFKWPNVWCTTLHQGDSVFANDWRLTETPDNKGIRLIRPDGTIAQEWR